MKVRAFILKEGNFTQSSHYRLGNFKQELSDLSQGRIKARPELWEKLSVESGVDLEWLRSAKIPEKFLEEQGDHLRVDLKAVPCGAGVYEIELQVPLDELDLNKPVRLQFEC